MTGLKISSISNFQCQTWQIRNKIVLFFQKSFKYFNFILKAIHDQTSERSGWPWWTVRVQRSLHSGCTMYWRQLVSEIILWARIPVAAFQTRVTPFKKKHYHNHGILAASRTYHHLKPQLLFFTSPKNLKFMLHLSDSAFKSWCFKLKLEMQLACFHVKFDTFSLRLPLTTRFLVSSKKWYIAKSGILLMGWHLICRIWY